MAEMGWAHMTAEMESRSRIYDFPDVWSKGNAGETLNSSEAVIYETLILDFNSLQFYRAINIVGLTGDVAEADSVFADTAGFLFDNPGAREDWESLRAKFRRYRGPIESDDLASIWERGVREKLAVLDEMRE